MGARLTRYRHPSEWNWKKPRSERVALWMIRLGGLALCAFIFFVYANLSGCVEFPRKVQTLSAGADRWVDIYHVPLLESLRADFRLRQGKKVLHTSEGFDGIAGGPREQMIYTVMATPDGRVIALLRVAEPKIIRALFEFATGSCWTRKGSGTDGQALFARFRAGRPEGTFALHGSDEAARIWREEHLHPGGMPSH